MFKKSCLIFTMFLKTLFLNILFLTTSTPIIFLFLYHFHRFDVMNSRVKNNQNKLASALGGPNTYDQFNVFDRMLTFLERFRVLHSRTGKIRTAQLPWQHGLICSIKSTKSLYNDLVVNGPFEFLMTAKLNQDCLENMFSRIRGTLIV